MHPPVAGLPASLELVVLQGRVVRPSRFRLCGHLPAGARCTPDSDATGVESSETASAASRAGTCRSGQFCTAASAKSAVSPLDHAVGTCRAQPLRQAESSRGMLRHPRTTTTANDVMPACYSQAPCCASWPTACSAASSASPGWSRPCSARAPSLEQASRRVQVLLSASTGIDIACKRSSDREGLPLNAHQSSGSLPALRTGIPTCSHVSTAGSLVQRCPLSYAWAIPSVMSS